MEPLLERPSTKGPAQMFTGDVWFDVVARGEAPSRVRVNTVRFAPCARTAWHSHSLGQTLHVTDGVGRIRARGGEVIEFGPGDVMHTLTRWGEICAHPTGRPRQRPGTSSAIMAG
jgi:quercetin dioxygenase-like cupin family protein